MTTIHTLSTALVPLHRGDFDGPPFPFLLVPLTFWLVVVGLVTWLVLSRRSRERTGGMRTGEKVLAERYAEGSIDEEEYRARRAVLRERG